jgi:UDP:flavonoid glycosyltransferase YjiC (YdhE family)
MVGAVESMSGATHQGRRRVLFVGEAVTLAHVSRPLTLAGFLDPAQYDVHIACDDRFSKLFDALPYTRWPLHSIPSQAFLHALAKGRPVYNAATLRGYVQDDLALIKRAAPDLIVGDFRLSLGVSARLAGIPYANVTNAYWSPYARQRYPVPDLPFTKVLGVPLAQVLCDLVLPTVFALHTRPLAEVRRAHGLDDLGYDLRRTYTDADVTLYADVPELIPTVDLPSNHHYLGPVSWQPQVELPAWWNEIPDHKPVVYVTLGSSGSAEALPEMVEVLCGFPCSVIVATAGRGKAIQPRGNVFVADFLPGEDAARRADLVVCNGGSPTTSQALVAGVPVIGVPSNLDQHLNMTYVARARAGVTVRPGRGMARALKAAVEQTLGSDAVRRRAAELSQTMSAYSPARIFPEFVGGMARWTLR